MKDSGFGMGKDSNSGMRGLGIHREGTVMTGTLIRVRILLIQGRLGGTTATVVVGQQLTVPGGLEGGGADW